MPITLRPTHRRATPELASVGAIGVVVERGIEVQRGRDLVAQGKISSTRFGVTIERIAFFAVQWPGGPMPTPEIGRSEPVPKSSVR